MMLAQSAPDALTPYSRRTDMARPLSPAARMERSILTDFRKTLWKPFIAAIKQYELIREGDRIAVCISGGKDSVLLASSSSSCTGTPPCPLSWSSS